MACPCARDGATQEEDSSTPNPHTVQPGTKAPRGCSNDNRSDYASVPELLLLSSRADGRSIFILYIYIYPRTSGPDPENSILPVPGNGFKPPLPLRTAKQNRWPIRDLRGSDRVSVSEWWWPVAVAAHRERHDATAPTTFKPTQTDTFLSLFSRPPPGPPARPHRTIHHALTAASFCCSAARTAPWSERVPTQQEQPTPRLRSPHRHRGPAAEAPPVTVFARHPPRRRDQVANPLAADLAAIPRVWL